VRGGEIEIHPAGAGSLTRIITKRDYVKRDMHIVLAQQARLKPEVDIARI
jgi:hypothetical protein